LDKPTPEWIVQGEQSLQSSGHAIRQEGMDDEFGKRIRKPLEILIGNFPIRKHHLASNRPGFRVSFQKIDHSLDRMVLNLRVGVEEKDVTGLYMTSRLVVTATESKVCPSSDQCDLWKLAPYHLWAVVRRFIVNHYHLYPELVGWTKGRPKTRSQHPARVPVDDHDGYYRIAGRNFRASAFDAIG
jgi:hypothetical protein